MTQKIFLPAITGAQQSNISQSLRTAGYHVTGSSRSKLSPGVSLADLETGEGLAEAMSGADTVVMTLPQEHRPTKMLSMVNQVVKGASSAGVNRFILNTAGTISESSMKPLFMDMRSARDIVQQSGLDWTILQPTVFLDNLLAPWSIDAIRAGSLNYPAISRARISWISHRDLAAYVTAVIGPDHVGKEYHVGGPDALAGVELAQQIGSALGTGVTYNEVPLDAFAQGIDAAFGAPAGERLASLYAELEETPNFMRTDNQLASSAGLDLQSAEVFFSVHA